MRSLILSIAMLMPRGHSMRHKLVMSRSSYLTSLPVLITFLVFGLLAAVWEWNSVSALLIFLFLFSLLARLWAQISISKLTVTFEPDRKGIFPGETLDIKVNVKNNKILPVLWMELFLPLSKKLCMIPEQVRIPEEWEKASLVQSGASDTLVGSYILPGLLWNEESSETLTLKGEHRGVYSANLWRLRAGDGFGLAQVDSDVSYGETFAVFPGLKEVDPAYFLRNLWNTEVGAKGVMEDLTVIRSTRAYSAGDPAKKINWRLRARGLPLQVNVYEDTLPRGVHFIFDGESFSGPEPHPEALEETLSILASLTLALESEQAYCSLSLPQDMSHEPMSVRAEHGTEALLWAMAGYEPCENIRDESGKIIHQRSVFDETEVFLTGNSAGRNYYVLYDMKYIPQLLSRLEPSNTTILTWSEEPVESGFETVCLRSFLTGGAG